MSGRKSQRKPRKRNRDKQRQNPVTAKAPPPAPPSRRNQANLPINGIGADDKNTSELPEPKRSINWDWWFAAGLVFAAFTQAALTYWNWDAMRKQNDIMLDQNKKIEGQIGVAKKATEQTEQVIAQMQLDQRPWLNFEKPKIDNLGAGKGMVCSIYIRNTGKTPGTVGRAAFQLTIESWGDGKGVHQALKSQVMNELFGLENFPDAAIAPNQSLRHEINPPPIISQEDMRDLESGKSVVCLVGRIIYSDVNTETTGQFHSSACCYIYNPAVGRFYGYEQGNRMD